MIPEWIEVEKKIRRGEPLSALEDFVHSNEPAGIAMTEEFRSGLAKVLQEQNAARDRVISFYASVIKSGEPWTPECQAARDALK